MIEEINKIRDILMDNFHLLNPDEYNELMKNLLILKNKSNN